MKNTDFDYIKEKFNNSDVNSPKELNEAFVMGKISQIEPLKVKKSKKKIIAISSAAAALAIVTSVSVAVAGILGGFPFGKNPFKPIDSVKGEIVSVSGNAKLTRFSDRDEVKGAIKKVFEFNKKLYRSSYDGVNPGGYGGLAFSSGMAYDAAGSLSESSGHNATYVQHTGVDEADTVKTDGKYIYYLSSIDSIEIFTVNEKNSEKVAQIDIETSEEDYFEDFYIYEDKLIALSSSYVSAPRKLFHEPEYKPITKVGIYDISSVENIKLTDSFSQSGSYCSSRMIDGMLYVVSTQYSYDENDLPFVYENSATRDEATFDEIPADCIYSVENPTNSNFLVVSSINTDDSAQATITKAILGSADEVYCNQENLYVTAGEYEPSLYEKVMNDAYSIWDFAYSPSISCTQIVKVSLENDIEFTATGKVKGRIDDQYSLDEYNGNLRVATTSVNNYGLDENNLFVLDEDLNQIGEVTGFAINESIQAVRYIDDAAYVITYEQTDPLFIIDVSNPTDPKITGEVKISGFSTMLVPIDDNTLLGIGYHTSEEDYIDMEVQDGLKIVTFDVSDKNNPKVLDTKIYEGYESEVQYNPKALLVNFERNDFTIPINYSPWDSDMYVSDESYSGTLNFRVDNGKINIIDEYISEKLSGQYKPYYGGVERCVYVGDYIYMIGSDSGYQTDIDCVKYK